MKVGQDIVCAGYVGNLGTQMILNYKYAELARHFSRAYLDAVAMQAAGSVCAEQKTASLCEAEQAADSGKTACAAAEGRAFLEALEHCGIAACDMLAVGRGGVLAALWNFCSSAGIDAETGVRKNNGLGCTYSLKDIPVLQGSIELCEQYELNPYRLYTKHAYLLAADNGGQLVRRLAAAGIPAAVIGELTDGRARARIDGEEVAYLTREQRDELEKLFDKAAYRALCAEAEGAE